MTKARLKRLIIIGCTVLILTVVWYLLSKYRPWDIRIPVIAERKNAPDFEFSGVSIQEVSGPNSDYILKATDLSIDKEKGLMNKVVATILSNNKPSFTFTANKGVVRFMQQNGIFVVFSGKTLLVPSWTITAPQASWDQRAKTISIEHNPIATQGKIKVMADKFTYFIPFQFMMLEKNCDISYGAYHLTCDKATIKDKIETIALDGQVFMEGQDLKIRADHSDIGYSKNEVAFKNNIIFEAKQSLVHADQVVVDEKKNIITFTNKAKLAVKDISIESDRAILNRNTNIMEFFENTKAWKGSVQIQSNSILFDLNNNEFVASGGGRTKIIKNSD